MEFQMFDLAGKTAMVSGASSGLGEHFANVLARVGARVAVGARRADRLGVLVKSITDNGGHAVAINMDVTDGESVNAAIDKAESALGPIDILVNNAGVASSKRFVNVDEENWDLIMDTNLKGAWRVGSQVARRMLGNKTNGSIINIASILGLRVGFGEAVYAISKAGVVQMTKAMALEFANAGIRVNALCPGYFKTEMNAEFFQSEKGKEFIKATPARRLGRLEELDGPLVMLASNAGSFINGAAIPVDGGHLVSSL